MFKGMTKDTEHIILGLRLMFIMEKIFCRVRAAMVLVTEKQSSALRGGLETKPYTILNWLQISTAFQSCLSCKNEVFLDLVWFKKTE